MVRRGAVKQEVCCNDLLLFLEGADMSDYIDDCDDLRRAIHAPVLGVFPHIGEDFDIAINDSFWQRLRICIGLLLWGRARVNRKR
jgi:hypothetical protein